MLGTNTNTINPTPRVKRGVGIEPSPPPELDVPPALSADLEDDLENGLEPDFEDDFADDAEDSFEENSPSPPPQLDVLPPPPYGTPTEIVLGELDPSASANTNADADADTHTHTCSNPTAGSVRVDFFTAEEQAALATLEAKFTDVKDAVTAVVKNYQVGLFLWGEGGCGKSYQVLSQLKALKANFILHNSRMTGRGLVDALEEAPTSIHVIEDAETLLEDKRAFGVLRSALWASDPAAQAQCPQPRRISWRAHKTSIDFVFTGAIIIISNANLADQIAEVRAIKSRITVKRMDVTAAEVLALAKQICMKGHRQGQHEVSPDECLMVRDYIVSKLPALNRPMDLRLLPKSFASYLQWREGDAMQHWQTILDGLMREAVVYQTRDMKNAMKHTIAIEIHGMSGLSLQRKLALWEERTRGLGQNGKGLDQAAYYRALKREK